MHFKAAAGPEHYGQIPQSIAPIHAPILVRRLYRLASNLWLSPSSGGKQEMTAFINTVSFQPGRRTRLMLTLGPRRENTFLSRVFGNKEKSDVLGVVGRVVGWWGGPSKSITAAGRWEKWKYSEVKSGVDVFKVRQERVWGIYSIPHCHARQLV